MRAQRAPRTHGPAGRFGTAIGRRGKAVRLLPAALLIAGACSYSGGEIEPYRPAILAERGGVEQGSELYARDCAWCHGNRGQGTEFGPNLVTGTNGPALTEFVLSTGRMPLDFPEQRMVRRPSEYSDDEIDSIVDYVGRFDQRGPEIPQVDVSSGDLAFGGELYQENCAACHSTVGIGGALAAGRTGELPGVQSEEPAIVAPGLADASPTEIAEAVLTGTGTMPVFGAETLSKDQLDAIVRYVVELQHPDNRGGVGMGGTGPVAEGAVGWILGLGLLIALIRWLGTKSGQDDERHAG